MDIKAFSETSNFLRTLPIFVHFNGEMYVAEKYHKIKNIETAHVLLQKL